MFKKSMVREHRIFWRFILSYIILLGVPLVIGVFFYREAVLLMEKDAKSINLSFLIQVRDVLDSRLTEIESTTQQIAMMPVINTLLNTNRIEIASPKYINVWNAWINMPNYSLTNTYIYNAFVFFRDANVMLSHRGAGINKPILYGRSLKHPELDFQEWQNLLWTKTHNARYLPGTLFTIDGIQHNLIAYMQSIPIGNLSPLGVVMIMIEENEIQKLLSKINIGDNGIVYLTNKTGEVITYIKGDSALIHPDEIEKMYKYERYKLDQDEKMIVSRVTSDTSGWSYTSVVCRDLVMSRVNYAKQIGLVVITASLFMGVGTAYFLAYRNTKPINTIVRIIKSINIDKAEKDEVKYTDEFVYLQNSILNMAQTSKDLKDELDRQMPVLKTSFFNRLFNGEFTCEEEIYAYSSHLGIQLAGHSYTALILRIDGYNVQTDSKSLNQIAIIKSYVRNLLTKYDTITVYCLDLSLNKLAMLIIMDDTNNNYHITKNLTYEIYQEIRNVFDNELFFAVGSMYENILSVVSSFNEAKQVLEYRGNSQRSIAMWFSDIPQRGEDCYYPIDLELRIISCVKTGNVEEMERIIRTVYIENFVKRQLSNNMIEQLMFLMKGTILRELCYVHSNEHINENVNENLKKIETLTNLDEIFNLIQKTHSLVCHFINDLKRNDKIEFKNRVIAYIDKTFMQENLSLYSIAEQFKVSESYMYYFFKENIGATFSDYLEAKRIQHACAMLTSTELPIKEIAYNSGYSNDHTFRRAFKKVIGITPSDYKMTSSP